MLQWLGKCLGRLHIIIFTMFTCREGMTWGRGWGRLSVLLFMLLIWSNLSPYIHRSYVKKKEVVVVTLKNKMLWKNGYQTPHTYCWLEGSRKYNLLSSFYISIVFQIFLQLNCFLSTGKKRCFQFENYIYNTQRKWEGGDYFCIKVNEWKLSSLWFLSYGPYG